MQNKRKSVSFWVVLTTCVGICTVVVTGHLRLSLNLDLNTHYQGEFQKRGGSVERPATSPEASPPARVSEKVVPTPSPSQPAKRETSLRRCSLGK